MPGNNGRMAGNRGEWSELYAFLKLLAQGRIYAANERVMRIDSIYYPILKIMREEIRGRVIEYVIGDASVDIRIGGETVMSVEREEVARKALVLLHEISSSSGRSFEVQEIAEFANGIRVTKLKAPSTDTTDISMQIRDVNTSYVQDVGFSIKSEVGSAPTLLNPGFATNFTYKVTGITPEQAAEINGINTYSKLKDRIARIYDLGGRIEFHDLEHAGFKRNLNMLDGDMDKILGCMLLYLYAEDVNKCAKSVRLLGERDPLGYGEPIIYEYKFKQFLCACALGLKPAKPWDGEDEANGGYIIVKADGEVLAYHIHNRNAFKQYLLDNTALEKPSSTRYNYMSLYGNGGSMYLKLNLQIRFR